MVDNVEKQGDPENKGPRFGVRHIQSILCFTLIFYAYCTRVNLSVGIVAMTDSTTSKNPDIPTYNWKDNSVVLSSFYWGYVILQIAAGQIVKKYGPKWFLVGAISLNSAGCLLIPLFAETFGSKGVMGLRMLQGLCQGFVLPSVHTLLGKWCPPNERSTIGTFVYSGNAFGTVVAMPVTGWISASWVGWPVSFYFFGALGLAWIVPWIFLGSNKPSEHKWISKEERCYVEKSLGNGEHVKELPTPWKPIAKSMPMWAIIVAAFGQCWGYTTLLTEIPTYLNKIMDYDMHSNALLSAAPYFAQMVLNYLFGPISDFSINHHYISRTNARKLFHSLGVLAPAVALICLGFVPDDKKELSITLLVIAVGVNSATNIGFIINAVDLAPNFSGTLMGIANGSSNIFSIIAPLVVQAVVGDDEKNKLLWRTIFIVSAVVYIVSDVFYLIFASGEVQYWNEEITETNNGDLKKPVDIDSKTENKF